MKTASALAWVFPGMGHYYSGQVGKGMLFTGLELIAIGGILGSFNEYSKVDQQYQDALLNKTGDGVYPTNCGELNYNDCYHYWKSEAEISLDSKNGALIATIASSTLAGTIWIWNIRDVKKNRTNNYSYANRFSLGVNRYGQIEARIKF